MLIQRLTIITVMFCFLFTAVCWADEIHEAALKGDIAKVKMLLKKDPGLLNSEGSNKKKPIHWAAQGGHKELVEFLLNQGAPVDTLNIVNETPLHYAADFGHKAAAELLLARGADIDAIARERYTPLAYAIMDNRPELIEYLISKGANFKSNPPGGINIFCHAAIKNPARILDLFIKKGALVNSKDDFGRTPLFFAVMGENVEGARFLIRNGADLNIISQDNVPLLYLAAQRGFKDMVSLLLESGAPLDSASTAAKQTPLHIAALNGYGDIAALLLEKGANSSAQDAYGKTPMDYAIRYSQVKVVKALINSGVKVENLDNVKEKLGFTPLLKKELKPGTAIVWYLGHSGWAIRTANHFLVFDYFKFSTPSDTPFLMNGTINPEEIKDLPVTVFSSHAHNDHFSPAIFDWKKDIKNIAYILGFTPDEKANEATIIGPREKKTINGMEIVTIKSNDSGVGFFIRVDGVNILHPGDHANRKQDYSEPFKEEIEYLSKNGCTPDIMFAPITGCGFGDIEAVKMGIHYTIKTLNPKLVIPMHNLDREIETNGQFIEELKKAGFETPVFASGHPGDWFAFFDGSIKKCSESYATQCSESAKKCCNKESK